MKDKLFLALMEAYSMHAESSRMIFQKYNLSAGQPKVLYILNIKDGYLQKELAKICKVTQPTMTALLNNMEKQDLIRKEKILVSGGKRAYCIYLTEKGKEIANEVDKNIEELEHVGFNGFSDEERHLLLEMLGRVSENLSKNIYEDL